MTSNDVIIDILTYFTKYITSEFTENLHTSSTKGLIFGGTVEFSRLPPFDLDMTSSDLQWRHNWHFDIFHPVYPSEFSENLHTLSPQGLVFGGTIEFSRLPQFDLHLTSSDLQWRHNWYFDIFHPVYHVRIFWKFPHTLPPRSSFWRYHRIFEATSIWPRFDLQWPPMTS